MSTSVTRVAFPSGPLLDQPTGELTPAWRGFFQSLYLRTGGSPGADTSALVTAEREARVAADQALTDAIETETAARQSADAAETLARQQADAAEALARQQADALLVPIAQLCSLWAACDLSFLPISDPGGGKPWLDSNHIAVGTPAIAIVDIGLEDGTGRWGLEDGTGGWVWG